MAKWRARVAFLAPVAGSSHPSVLQLQGHLHTRGIQVHKHAHKNDTCDEVV